MKISKADNLMDANKLKLVDYLSLPKAMRPMTLKMFAKQVLGVSEPTVHAWKNDDDVIASVKKNIRSKFADDIPDVLMALRDNAMAGNARAAKLFLAYVADSIKPIDEPKKEMSVEETKREIERITKMFYPAG